MRPVNRTSNRDDGNELFDDRHDARLPRSRNLPPRGPKSARVEKTGGGIRVTVFAWPPESIEVTGSGATQFLVYWAETVDQTTEVGVKAGFARATLLSPAIPVPGESTRSDQPIVGTYSDPKYLTGYFYIIGQSADGQQSEPGQPIKVTSGTGAGTPNDVEHFLASESGEADGLITHSVVDYSFRVPMEGAPIDRIQFMYLNYPNLNEFSEGESRRVTVGKGGTQTGRLRFPVGRRLGEGAVTIVGTAVTGVGTNFLSVAAAAGGDQLEVFGVQARIASVASNTAMTLDSAWTGPDVTSVDAWQTIASVTIYAVSEGADGARRDDPENAPHVTLDFDGLLSPPIAPTLTLTAIGNFIRCVIEPPSGTDLARALLYRKTGTGAFDKADYAVIYSFEIDHSNPLQSFQFDDSDFTIFERENGQRFSYAATVVNVRDQESDPSTVAEADCRLDAPSDNGSTVPAREIALNQLWNGHINGTVGAVGAADAVQDSNMGGAPPAGRNHWVGRTAGVGSAPGHLNTTEVVLAMTGAGAGMSSLDQDIDGWDNATAANRRIPTSKLLTLQVKARTSGGQPNGILYLEIEQWNGGALSGNCAYRRRLSNDAVDTSLTFLGVNGSDILADHHVYWGVFVPAPAATTTFFRARIHYDVTNWNNVNIVVTEAMLSFGEAIPQYTPQMADPSITFDRPTGGAPLTPGGYPPDEGGGQPFIEILVP